jgi:hypothetical protein
MTHAERDRAEDMARGAREAGPMFIQYVASDFAPKPTMTARTQEHTPSYTSAQMEQVRAEFQSVVAQRNALLEQRDDLLDACDALLQPYARVYPDGDICPPMIRDARAAIARARGSK